MVLERIKMDNVIREDTLHRINTIVQDKIMVLNEENPQFISDLYQYETIKIMSDDIDGLVNHLKDWDIHTVIAQLYSELIYARLYNDLVEVMENYVAYYQNPYFSESNRDLNRVDMSKISPTIILVAYMNYTLINNGIPGD